MLILLPPSEGKTAPRRGKPLDLAALTCPELTDARRAVIDALVDLCSGDVARAAELLEVGATQHDLVAVTSSVFGVVRPGDRIPAYRLSGGTTLPGLGSVAGHWRAHLDPAMTDLLGGGLLVDLRSAAYAAFWRPGPELASRVATVRVLHEVDGKRKVVSHFNKATKGRITRALLEDGANPGSPARLAEALRDLGWMVEVGEPPAKGTQLAVVVEEL